MNPRSSLLILDTKTLLVHRMSARKATRISPILVGTCPLSSSGAGVSISSSMVWADLVSCFDQQRGTSVRLCDPRTSALRPFTASVSPSWKPAAMWKVPALLLAREALWRVTPEGKRPCGESRRPSRPPPPCTPSPRSLSSHFGSYAVHLCKAVLEAPASAKLPAGCPCDLSWCL